MEYSTLIDHIHPDIFINNSKENIMDFLIFHCDNESIHLLELMMKECLSLNKSNKLIITAINENRFLSMIEQLHNEKSCKIEYCSVMEMNRSTFEKAKLKIKDIPYGAYRDNKLVSWRLLQYNRSLRMGDTVEKERQQSLSSILNIKLAEKLSFVMTSYFDEYNCEPLGSGEEPNYLFDLSCLLLANRIVAEF